MSKIDISQQKIIVALESRSPKSLTELYRILGGDKLSGKIARQIRLAVPGIEKILEENKGKTAKADGEEVSAKSKPAKKAEKKPAKAPKKSAVPRHPKNPFREGSGYGLILDIIADAGSKGIGKEDLLKAYGKISGKDLTHAKYDLAVVTSAAVGRTRHRSMKDGATIILDGANYQVRFP